MYLKDLTFIIPVRLDTIERIENIIASTNYLLHCFDTKIIVLEACEVKNNILEKLLDSRVDYIYMQDKNPVFHRTKYLNVLSKLVVTPFLAVWDADVIVSCQQIISSIQLLRHGGADIVYPYDGRFLDTTLKYRKLFIVSSDIKSLYAVQNHFVLPYGIYAIGGGFLANRFMYSCSGGENENFYGWGPEDQERLKRWEILEYNIKRVEGPMFHLSHPRGINSCFGDYKREEDSIKELLRICKMKKKELCDEIKHWNW